MMRRHGGPTYSGPRNAHPECPSLRRVTAKLRPGRFLALLLTLHGLTLSTLLGLTLALSTLAAAQPEAKPARVGLIGERSSDDPWLESFRRGLRELGYVEGRSIVVEYRFAHGVSEAFPTLAAELVRTKVDVMVVGGGLAAGAAKAASSRIPVVFVHVGDPVGAGLVTSLSRPGGNVTGLSNAINELGGKQLELLKSAVPKSSRIGILHNPLNSRLALVTLRDAARSLMLDLELQELRRPSELPAAFSALMARKVDAVLALSDPVFGVQLPRLAELSSEHRMPSMYARREFADAGGLLAYGPDFAASYRRAATYVDRILKGAKAGELPVERPTQFELVINLKTARRLGLAIDPSLLQRADRLIE